MSETIRAKLVEIDRYRAALRRCRNFMVERQQELLRDNAIDGNRETMLSVDLDDLAEIEHLIAGIDAALDGAAP